MDLYKVLGLQGGLDGGAYASSAEIRRAYRSRTLQCHPDKRRDDQEKAAEEFQTLQDAYKVLSDETQRKDYDNKLYDNLLKGPIQPAPQKKKKKSKVTGLEGILKPKGGIQKRSGKQPASSSTSSSVRVSLGDVAKIKSKYGITGETCGRTVCCSWSGKTMYDEAKLRETLGLFGPIDKVYAPAKCNSGSAAVVFKFRASASGAVAGMKDDPELKLFIGG